MRALAIAVTLTVLTASAATAQRTVLVRIDNGGANTGRPADLIARRTAMRAWQDSVEVYLQGAGMPQGWRMAPPGASTASFLVHVVAVPISKPGYSGVAMAVAVMEPATFSAWKYVLHYVSVSDSAEEAAIQLASGTVQMLQTAGR